MKHVLQFPSAVQSMETALNGVDAADQDFVSWDGETDTNNEMHVD